MPHKIAILVGSLRQDSFNRKIANAFINLAPASLSAEIVDIADLSFFNQDLEANPPASWTAFREKIKPAAGVLFCTPEYNRSVPGVLKNALDIASRPYGNAVITGKPAAIISGTMGTTGAFGANHHLRQSFTFLNMPTMQQPEAYLSALHESFDAAGNPVERTKNLLTAFAAAFASWVELHTKK